MTDGVQSTEAPKVREWDLELGQEDSRTAIHARHGGSTARGISAPARGSGRGNILLWWKPEHGHTYGYVDGWTASGEAFYFTGTGQEDDQVFTFPLQENGRLRDHAQTGDHVRLLRYKGKNQVEYVAELRLDPERPWAWLDGLDRTGHVRRVIQFRLLPIGQTKRFPKDPVRVEPPLELEETEVAVAPAAPTVQELEGLRASQFKMLVRAQAIVGERREAVLVHAFAAWLHREHNLAAKGLNIPHSDGSTILRVDAFIPHLNLLIEAKSSSARESIRLAIGQLFDYARWLEARPILCVLLPHRPAEDMLDLLHGLDISCIWRSRGAFEVTPLGLLQSGGSNPSQPNIETAKK